MKNIYLLIAFLFLTSLSLVAQEDQVSFGSSYSEQAFYNISTGESHNFSGDTWDIAFSNLGSGDAGVFINESSPFMGAELKLYETYYSDWADEIDPDGSYSDEFRLLNEETNWTDGAFNSIKAEDDPIDFGWGEYDAQEHKIIATRIYVIQKRNGQYLKIQIQSLDADGVYTFRYANLDGTNEYNMTISTQDDEYDSLIYFSFAGNTVVDIPIDYDLIFQRYSASLETGGEVVQYVVAGTLVAPGVQAVAALGINPETVSEEDYSDLYSTSPNSIGHEWKYFDLSTGWVLSSDLVYFVKLENGDKYMIQFTDFAGSSSGVATLNKTFLGTSANNETNIAGIVVDVYPNPFVNFITVSDVSNQSFDLTLTDISGKVVLSASVNSNEKLHLPNDMKSGDYFIRMTTKNSDVIVRKLIKL